MFGTANANVVEFDTSDPLYMPRAEEILSESTVSLGHDILRFGEKLSYGLNDRLVLSASVHYQNEFGGNNDGFSSTDLGGVYRAGVSDTFISDVIFGFKFGGSRHVRTPEYADSTYYAGWRFGRQWAGVTLAATIQSNWIFDDERGMSYIDFTPQAYFRLDADWRLGIDATIRKATKPSFNQEWVGMKVVRQFGRTQYIGHVDYEFEGDDVQIGARVNILF
jgi:hypothetical protein